MTKVLEREIERKVVRYLRAKGGTAVKLTGTRGIPDRMFIMPKTGYVLLVEFKTAKGRLSPIQEVVLKRLSNEGHQVAVVRSVTQGIDLIDSYEYK